MDVTERQRVEVAELRVDPVLFDFVEGELLLGSGISPDVFWQGLADLVHGLGPRNRELLAARATMQSAIDDWHRQRRGEPQDRLAYRSMLESIGYLLPAGEPFVIDTERVDAEIAAVAGPQLVVPVMNARYALNAANARWGSLYDALYGTDAMGDLPTPGPYDPERGGRVVGFVRQFLDDVVPLAAGSHAAVTSYRLDAGALVAKIDDTLVGLAAPAAFTGYVGPPDAPTSVLLTNNGLRIELIIDRASQVGAAHRAGVSNVVIESAVTAIMDFEDSVAAVDADDKVAAYRNWLGLMRGDLSEVVTKADVSFTRRLNADRVFVAPNGVPFSVPSRALLLARNVGHLMTSPAVLDRDGREAPEGLVDALVTVTAALHDLARPRGARNSRAGSVYIVKPKMHGPNEVAFAVDTLAAVERVLGLPADTVKIGIMDEERRTTVNLSECIRAARSRVAFINTGFLDRTGDEIHTSMEAGAMVRKADMRTQPWIAAYEDWNVDVGLACGLPGRAQIGKGMWAAPDLMADMLAQKIGHPQAGANCAWVPSPTAATLHATHYHRIDVRARQDELRGARRATLDDLLRIPLAGESAWSEADRQAELDNNAQGILGYVVRWIDQGVGCSKVPDIHGVGLMEDRATCRISSQHIANWMRHGVVDEAQVRATFAKMAAVVDAQNAGDPQYTPMAPACDGIAFTAALELVLAGVEQPSGYTEPVLHARRTQRKRER